MAGKEWYTVVGYWGDAHKREIWHEYAHDADEAIRLVNMEEAGKAVEGDLEYIPTEERGVMIAEAVSVVEQSLLICAVFLGKHECQCT